MKYLANLSLALCLGFLASVALAQDEAPPEELVFESKIGNVTFQHAEHIAREGDK